MQVIQQNNTAIDYLGNDFKRKGMISGSLSTNANGSGNADLSFKIKGKDGTSRIYVSAYKENYLWNYTKIILYKNLDSSEYIDLLKE